MKLTFCFGKTNSDASLLALDSVKPFLNKEKIYIVVPDRASLITELASLGSFGTPGAFNFRVLTINTLASMIRDEGERKTLSSFGGNLLVKKILKEERQNLVCFNKISSNMNFASEMYGLIQQFKSSHILPENLDVSSSVPDGTKLKAQDIKRVWTRYEEEIEKKILRRLF